MTYGAVTQIAFSAAGGLGGVGSHCLFSFSLVGEMAE